MKQDYSSMAKNNARNEEQDMKTVNMVQDMFKRSEQAKEPFIKRWKECISAYNGDYFNEKMPDYKSDNISNYVYSTIETMRPIMMAENPKFQVLPRLEKDFPKSAKVQQGLDYEWQREKMGLLLPKIMIPMLTIGTSAIALLWDSKDSRIGNIKPIYVSAFNLFPDPAATTIDDAEYIIYATYKSLGSLIKQFPNKAEALKLEAKMPDKEELNYGQDQSTMGNKMILVCECYMNDYATFDEIEEEEGQTYQVTKLKYPNGRRLLVAGDVLLDDSENPYEDGKFPFVIFKDYDLPSQFWGEGEAWQIVKPNKNANILTNQVLDNARTMANPQWILDKNSGIEKGALTNRPGLVIRKNPGTEVRRDQPPAIPSYVQETAETLKRDIEVITGVFDVTRGEKPGSVTAGSAIQTLTQTAQSRIVFKTKLLEESLSVLGAMWINRIRQFWTLPRQIRVMASAKDLAQMQSQGADVQGAIQVGQYQAIFTTLQGDEIDGDFDINVVGGSTMPVNKNARLQMLIQLAQTTAEDGLPCIDRQTILENSELPNVEEVMTRFDNLKAQQQQAQQEQLQTQLQAQQQSEQMQMQQQAEQQAQAQEQEQAQMESQANDKVMSHQMELEKAQHNAKLDMMKENNKASNQMELNDAQMKAQMENSESDKASDEGSTENSKQDNTSDVSQNVASNGEYDGQVEQILKYLETLSDEELQAYLQQHPEIVQLLQSISGTSESTPQ